MLWRPILAVCALAFLGCGGSDGPTDPGTGTPSLRLAADTARVGTMLSVVATGSGSGGETMSGTLGGVAVTLARVGDSTFALLVPEAAAGTSQLEVGMAGQPVQVAVTVLPGATIANPGQWVSARLDAYVAAVPTLAPDGITPTDWAERWRILDSLMRDAKARVAALPAAEQLAVARLLAAAGDVTAPGDDAASASRALAAAFAWSDPNCRSAIGAMARSGVISAAAAIVLGGPIALPAPPLVKVAGIGVGAAAYWASLMILGTNWVAMGESCYVVESVTLERTYASASRAALPGREGAPSLSVAAGAADSAFYPDVPVLLYPVGTARPVSRVDLALDPALAAVAASLDELYETGERIGRWARAVLPLPPQLSTVASQPAVRRPIHPNGVAIANVMPSTVTLRTQVQGAALQVLASGPSSADVPFRYDVLSTADGTRRSTRGGLFHGATGYVRFVIDGRECVTTAVWRPYTLVTARANIESSALRFATTPLPCLISIMIPRAVGTFSAPAPSVPQNHVHVTDPAAVWWNVGSGVNSPESVTITVTSLAEGRMVGTFSGTVLFLPAWQDRENPRAILANISGSFDVPEGIP